MRATIRATLTTLLLAGMLSPAAGQAGTTRPAPGTAPTFQNPVIASDMPDPDLLQVGQTYYAYSTNVGMQNTPVYRSGDLIHWTPAGDALPELPAWASVGFTWAPSLLRVPAGYRMYFTARHIDSGRQCIGVAAAAAPAGPYVSRSARPLVCQLNLGGSIDAQAITAGDGHAYLYWKNDGNCCSLTTEIWVQQLSPDGLRLVGTPKALLRNDQPWEGNLIEAPSVVRHAGQYYLFYSAGAWDSAGYAVGYAVAPHATGPFRKVLKAPVLVSSGQVAGPGGQGVINDGRGRTWMYYHAWTSGELGYDTGGVRSLRLDPLEWKQGVPQIRATTTRQAVPARP